MNKKEYIQYIESQKAKAQEQLAEAKTNVVESIQGMVAHFGTLEDSYIDDNVEVDVWELPVSKKGRTFKTDQCVIGGMFYYHRNGSGLQIETFDDMGDVDGVMSVEELNIDTQIMLLNNLIEDYK